MDNYEIVIDSTCDLSLELRRKFYVYDDYIHAIIYLPGNDDYKSDLAWETYTPEKYFSLVKKNAGKIKSAFATYEEFSRVVEPILKDGKDAIVVVISSGISGTYNGYSNFAEMLLDDYPERKIVIMDSLRYGGAAGLLAIYGGLNKYNGMSFEENVKWLNDNKNRIHQIGPMDDLSFLAKNGRISATKAFFGSLAGVQPMADFTFDGKSAPLGTIKGSSNANKIALSYLKKTIVNPKDQIVIVSHSDRKERATIFEEQLKSENLVKEIYTLSVGQSCGPTIGPGLCAYYYLGNELTEERPEETKVFNELKEGLSK